MAADTKTAPVSAPHTWKPPAAETLRLDPTAGSALFTLALVHLAGGMSGKALAVAQGLRFIAPTDPKYTLLVCACLAADRRYKEAEDVLSQYNLLPERGCKKVAHGAQLLSNALQWERGRTERITPKVRPHLVASDCHNLPTGTDDARTC